MSRETRYENYRVEVTFWTTTYVQQFHDKMIAAGKEVAAQIRRHCDDIESARVVSDAVHFCGHCGDRWTSEHPTYNGCCQRDLDDGVAAGIVDANGNMLVAEAAQ